MNGLLRMTQWWCVGLSVFALAGYAEAQQAPQEGRIQIRIGVGGVVGQPVNPQPSNNDTVVWISVDGVRPDYIERGNTPVYDRLSKEGAFTKALIPIFPSLTFPSHVSQVTGVPVSKHGVPGNSFYDSTNQRTYRFPPFSSMVQSEAIWETATRQGVRVAVQDWPMGHAQRGPHAAAHFGDRFDNSLTDRQRLEALLATWENDAGDQPLRLLIGWIGDPDKVGHSHGPDSDEVIKSMEATDELLGWFIERAQELWQAKAGPDDNLYLIISTDHGMSPVTTLVNPNHLIGLEGDQTGVVVITSANIGNVHVDQIEDALEREAMIRSILAACEAHEFVKAYRRETLPERWNYAHPTRVGDVVLVLDTGYTFSSRPAGATAPVEEFGGPLGMHGYDPATDENMLGYSVFWRTPAKLGGVEIEQVHSLQLHATIARMLGIKPAQGAMPEPVELPWEAVVPVAP